MHKNLSWWSRWWGRRSPAPSGWGRASSSRQRGPQRISDGTLVFEQIANTSFDVLAQFFYAFPYQNRSTCSISMWNLTSPSCTLEIESDLSSSIRVDPTFVLAWSWPSGGQQILNFPIFTICQSWQIKTSILPPNPQHGFEFQIFDRFAVATLWM